MLVLAVLLLLLAGGVTAIVVLGAPDTRVQLELGGFSVSMEPLWVFLTGAVTVLLLVLGLELLRAGVRRANNRRRDQKELNRLAAQARESERSRPRDTGDTRALEPRSTDPSTAEVTRTDGGTAPDRIAGPDDVTGPDRRGH
jgi:hypothetical protein